MSWPAILQSYGDSVDLLSKDTKTLQLLMLDETLHIMDVSNTSELFGIIVPRTKVPKDINSNMTDAEVDAENIRGNEISDDEDSDIGMTTVRGSQEEEVDDSPTLVTPGDTIKWYEQMVYHQVLIDKSYAAANIEIRPTNPDAELLLFFNYKYKPLPDHYELMMPIRKIVDYGLASFDNGTYNIFLGKTLASSGQSSNRGVCLIQGTASSTTGQDSSISASLRLTQLFWRLQTMLIFWTT